MRISADPEDPAYSEHYGRALVYCNGNLLENCFEADEELGSAWLWAQGPEAIVYEDYAGRQLFQVLGDIEIKIMAEEPEGKQ